MQHALPRAMIFIPQMASDHPVCCLSGKSHRLLLPSQAGAVAISVNPTPQASLIFTHMYLYIVRGSQFCQIDLTFDEIKYVTPEDPGDNVNLSF